MKLKLLFPAGVFLLFNCLFALGGLDLKFTGKISMSPKPAGVGDAVTFTVSLISDGAIVNNLKLIAGVNETQIVEKIFVGIANGGTRKQNMNWVASAGSHTVWFELDPDRSQKDGNYNNNRIEMTINIGGEFEPSEKLPDLVVPDAWASPATVEQGSNFTFNCDIQNKGGALKGKWFAAFLIDNKEVASKEFTDLPANGYMKYEYPFSGLQIGEHKLTCQVDPAQQIKELNEVNNSYDYSFQVIEKSQKLPDISVNNISYEPLNPIELETIKLGCEYGFTPGISVKEFKITLTVDRLDTPGRWVWDKTDKKSGTYTEKVQLYQGTYSYSCKVDILQEISESDESNNERALGFRVNKKIEEPKQDMYFSDIRTRVENDKTLSLCCEIGSKNFTQPFTYDYILDGQKISTQESTNGFGGCRYYALDKLTPGTHTLECVIDPQNKIPETDENNNHGSKTFVVEKKQALPDLLAQSVSTDKKKYSEGEEVQVVCFYKNIGGPFEGNWRLMVFVGGDSEYSNSVINTSGYVPWIWKAKGPGKYNVGCSLDTQGQVTESNENNNVVKDTIEVVPLKGVILFEHDNYNGAQEIFMADDPDLRNNVIGNDKASSIKVPAGCVATLYEHINYQGKSETFRGNDNWLGDNTIGNDNVSSIQVRCNN
jgi:subtilase family serine protease